MEARKGCRVSKERDGKTRGAKLLTVSNSGLQQNCYSPVQKLIPFEIVKNNKVNSNENHDEGHCNDEILARRAAVEGQQLRKIRDMYYGLLLKAWKDVESTWFLNKQSI